MTGGTNAKETLKVLIAVKTYPIPSAKYDELVCTAGVTERGDFIRLYPINFRDLPFSRQYRKYQWIEVRAEKHRGRDVRKESYRPDCATIRILGKPISTNPRVAVLFAQNRPIGSGGSSFHSTAFRWLSGNRRRSVQGAIYPRRYGRYMAVVYLRPQVCSWINANGTAR